MKAILLTLAISMPSCAALQSDSAAKALQDSAVMTGHTLAAVREAYFALCSEPQPDALKAKCAAAKDAFNKADAAYTKVNDQL